MSQLVKDVSTYVLRFLKENLSSDLSFHNATHTCEVVEAAMEIGAHSNLTETEMVVLEVAAWFHDCGYANTYIGHEEESKKIAKDFLSNYNCDVEFIVSILNCIEATKFPQSAHNTIEMVLCDADLYHFTKASYPRYAKALRDEFEIFVGRVYSDEEWDKTNCILLRLHSYFTDYGKLVLSKFKAVNIELLKCYRHV